MCYFSKTEGQNMYTAIQAMGVKKGINQRWQVIDITTIHIRDIYDQYRKVFLTLEVDSPAMLVYLDMDSIRSTHSTYDDTIEQMLIDLGTTNLPTLTELPIINTRSAKYMDAFRAGYSIKPYSALYGENVAMSDRVDLLLTRQTPVIDYATFYNTTLVSINGFYHRTDSNLSTGIIVYNASKSRQISNQNQIGLLTFNGMCSVQSHSITENMIRPLDTGISLSEGFYIDTGLDLVNKSVLFVIGGCLHALSGLILKTGDNTFKLDFPNYPVFDRFYEMRNHLDTSDFVLSVSGVNPDQIAVEELLTDDNIKVLMTMSQSFIVVLDCPEIYTERNYVRKTGFPGCYIAYTDPKYPLVTGLGRHNEYWYRFEDGQYILTVYDNAVSNRIYNTVDPYFENSIGSSELPTDPVYLSGAYLLMIARDI